MDAKLNARASAPAQRILLAIAVIFHAVGLVGIGILHSDSISRSTPMHLLLMGVLLFIASRAELPRFALWAAITAVVSFWAEWFGVHTGLLFGEYSYGRVLGPRALDIPLLIGLNWMLVLSGACTIAFRYSPTSVVAVLFAAGLATVYDYILEPVAIRLGYWSWRSPEIPLYNYFCWALLAAAFALSWKILRLRGNLFAAGLFVIQLVFFILLRFLL